MAALLRADRSQLLIIDLQDKLVPAMAAPDAVVSACVFLAETAGHCDVPTVLTEQYPKGLGHTVQPLLGALSSPVIVEKTAFSAVQEPKAIEALQSGRIASQRKQIVVCGVEAHVCVLQTCMDLQGRGFEVFVVADATASRKAGSKEVALSRLTQAGIAPVTSEMVAFEWIGDAKASTFRPVSALVRNR